MGVPGLMAAPGAAPLASTTAMSLVLVSPSTVIMLNETSTAALSLSCKNSLSTAASVVMKASIVAILG